MAYATHCFLLLYLFLFYLFKFAAQSLTLKRTTTTDQTPQQKNIVYGSIMAGGNVIIGDTTYINNYFAAQEVKISHRLTNNIPTNADHILGRDAVSGDNYDEKNIIKGSTIKAGGDFRLGDDVVSGNQNVQIVHNYFGNNLKTGEKIPPQYICSKTP